MTGPTSPSPGPMTPFNQRFARLLLFAGASCLLVFAVVLNLFPVDAAQPTPTPTHALQNQEDHDTRVTDQNALLYGNNPSTNAPPSSTNQYAPNALAPEGMAGTPPEHSAQPPPNGTPADLTAEQEADFKALMPEGTAGLPSKVLTRTQAIAQALSLNFDIRIKAYDEEVAQAQLRQAHGAFDPVLNAEGSYEDIRDPQNTQDFVATGGIPQDILNGDPRIFVENNQHYKIALDGKIPTGLQYEVKSQLDVLSNTLNETNPLSLFTPEYQSFTGITLDQPFLRGFGTDVNNSEIQAAIVNKLAVRYDVEDQMLSTVSQVLQSYFQLAYLTQELEAKREDRDLGIRLVRDRFLALEKGVISSREINHAESALAEIIEDYTKAQNEVIDQQAILQALLSGDEGQVGKYVYAPTVRMTPPELHQTEDELVSYALLHRPKFLEAREKVEEQNIRIVYAENQTWPQLDMKGTYGVNGLSSNVGNSYYRETIPQGPQWSIGLAVSIPFGNNDAGGKLDEATAHKEQSILAMKQIELDTNLLIRKEVAIFHSDENRFRAMQVFARTADDNLDQETVRQEKGLSTDLDVLKYQRDSTEAKARELAALADLNSAYVQIEETSGMLLDNLNIHVAPSP